MPNLMDRSNIDRQVIAADVTDINSGTRLNSRVPLPLFSYILPPPPPDNDNTSASSSSLAGLFVAQNPLVGIVTDRDPDKSSSPHLSRHRPLRRPHFPDPTNKAACARFRLTHKRCSTRAGQPQLWQELAALWQHVNELSSAMLEQSRNFSQILQVLTQPPPSLFPVHSEEDSGLCPTTLAAHPPPEQDAMAPDVIGDVVAPPRSPQPPSDALAHPPADSAPTLPGYSRTPLATSTSPSVPLRQTPRRTRDSDAALPKLRGIFNRKKAPS
ncbi:hypothetical protein R3P38DRAFT_3264066 [Favolaschia claudopus]|uniref:Uncharacterized protein n=1 Tax=Favolaschia claudopus TaxID=2862362 RepID=A0AAW0C401_9AGAR